MFFELIVSSKNVVLNSIGFHLSSKTVFGTRNEFKKQFFELKMSPKTFCSNSCVIQKNVFFEFKRKQQIELRRVEKTPF